MEWALSMTRHSSNSLIVESLLCFRNQADLQSSCSSGGVLEQLMSLRQRKTAPKMVFVSGRPCDHCCKRAFSLITSHWREMKLTPQFSYRGNIGLGKARGLGRVWNLNVYPGLRGLVRSFLAVWIRCISTTIPARRHLRKTWQAVLLESCSILENLKLVIYRTRPKCFGKAQHRGDGCAGREGGIARTTSAVRVSAEETICKEISQSSVKKITYKAQTWPITKRNRGWMVHKGPLPFSNWANLVSWRRIFRLPMRFQVWDQFSDSCSGTDRLFLLPWYHVFAISCVRLA